MTGRPEGRERLMNKTTALLLVLAFASGGCATDSGPMSSDRLAFVRDGPWIEVTSPRFQILSTMSEEETKGLARDLERFDALIRLITRADQTGAPVPTRIFAFKRKSEYRRFGGAQTAGFFVPGTRANLIVLSDHSGLLGASEIILHEYVHFVVRNGSVVNYPIWYDEGFAEFLSTARVFEDQMAVGALPAARILALRFGNWVSMDRIIAGRTYADFPGPARGMFYAEAWALVHYLTLERGSGTSMSRDLAQYLSLVEMGISAEAAFERAFGESPEEVGKKIRRRRRGEQWRVIGIPLEALDDDRTEPVVRVPSDAEIAIHLGQLSLAVSDGAAAEGSFRAALESDPSHARAEAGLGNALKSRGQWEDAEPHFRRAVELGPDDPFNHLDLAKYLHDLALEPDRARQRRALLIEARRAYERSRELDPSIPETWAWLGKTFLAPGEDPSKSLEPILHAVRKLPSSPAIVSLLVEAYVATGETGQARRVLGKSAAVQTKGPLHENLDEAIQEILDRRAAAEEAHRKAMASDGSPAKAD